jgi:hypothetical protein
MLRDGMQRDARDARCVHSAFERCTGQRARLAQDAVPREELRRYEEAAVKLQDNASRCFPVNKHVSGHRTLTSYDEAKNHQHSVTQESLGDLKGLISGTKEDLEDQLEAVRQTISAAGSSLRQVLLEDQARLQSSLDSIAQAQQIADTTQPKVIIEDNHGSQGSHTLFGTDTSQPGLSLTVARNEARVGAVFSAGVYSPQTLQALLQHSRTPDLALALKVLQTQSTSVRNEALQTALNVISAERDQGTHVPATILLTEAESPDSESLRQPVGSVQSVPADVESYESGLDSRVVNNQFNTKLETGR